MNYGTAYAPHLKNPRIAPAYNIPGWHAMSTPARPPSCGRTTKRTASSSRPGSDCPVGAFPIPAASMLTARIRGREPEMQINPRWKDRLLPLPRNLKDAGCHDRATPISLSAMAFSPTLMYLLIYQAHLLGGRKGGRRGCSLFSPKGRVHVSFRCC